MSYQIHTLEEYQAAYQHSLADPAGFWTQIAEHFHWRSRWQVPLKWQFEPIFDVTWFDGATLNITENCLDRHLATRGDAPALIWEPNSPDAEAQTLTFRELHARVCRFSNGLKALGVRRGDRVCIYLPMLPEAAIAMLACARIGAIHSVVFAGFSAQSLADRVNDAGCRWVITAAGSYRGAKSIAIKPLIDEALTQCPHVEKVVVLDYLSKGTPWQPDRDVWWHDLEAGQSDHCPAVEMNAEDMLFILYTSGSTGKPKGVVHTAGGYMVYTGYTFANVFQAQPGDVFWCTADVGWITGHSYLLYGALLNGITTVFFEGVPTWPDAGRFWQVIERHRVNIFYTAPTAIRALMAFGESWPAKYDLSSLRVLGSVGEPINEEAWHWYKTHIGKGVCALTDTWWQTETGGIMIAGLAGISPEKPGSAGLPLLGIVPMLVDEKGQELTGNDIEGMLCMAHPWPGMLRTTFGDHLRCHQNYFSTFKGLYFTGDAAKRDAQGMYRILGRVDDVINVSGHRLGTAEIESAIDEHAAVLESAVVGYPHDIKGQGIYAFVICESEYECDAETLKREIDAVVTKIIGPIAKPDKVQVVPGLPKTRSGKIMRRILRKVAEGDISSLGDTSTLLDPGVVEEIVTGAGLG